MTATPRGAWARASALILLCGPVHARPAASPEPARWDPPATVSAAAGDATTGGLTLSQAIEAALEANPVALRAREQLEEFRLQVREVRAEAFPNLDLNLAYQRTRDPGLRNSPFFSRLTEGPDPIPDESLAPFQYDTWSYRLDLEQPLYTFGRVNHAIRAAREELQGVRTDVEAVENQVALAVAQAYYAHELAREQLGVLENERRARQRQLQQVRDRFELEDATRLDVLKAEVALANLQPEILAADTGVRVALARLNEALGRPPEAAFAAADPLRVPDPVPSLPEPVSLLEAAAQVRPEVRRFDLTRRVLREAEGVTRAGTLPEIKANVGLGVSTFAFDNVSDLSFRTWSAGVSVKWTLFDGLRTSSKMGRLASQRRQSELAERSFLAGLARDMTEATGEWRRGLATVEVTELAVRQAREAERVAEESFRWGAATFLDVLEAERALRQAELNRTRAHHDALVALAQIKFLVGLRADASHERLAWALARNTDGDHDTAH